MGHTGALSTVYTEGNGNQPEEGRLGTEGTDNQTERRYTQWGTLYRGHRQPVCALCIYRGHRQPVRQGPTGALSTLHIEGTDNQPAGGEAGQRGHIQLGRQGAHTVGHIGALEHCQLYIQRARNQSDRGHTVGLSRAVNCTYRGHRQPVSLI